MSPSIYCFVVKGSANFLRAYADVQEEVLEPFFSTEEWDFSSNAFDTIAALDLDRQPKAAFGFDTAIVIMGFFGTCFAKKVFDEFYERTAKRPIGVMLDKLLSKTPAPAGKTVEYQDIFHLEDIDLVVVIRAVVEEGRTKMLQHQIMQAHRIAHGYIEKFGRQAPIHCHKIEAGAISTEPELFNSLKDIEKHDREQRMKRLIK